MDLTQKVITELHRCLAKMQQYRDGEITDSNPLHAAAVRASMDLSRLLVTWRKAPSYDIVTREKGKDKRLPK